MGVLNPVPQKDASKIVMGKLQLCTVVANCSHRSATSKLCDKKLCPTFWYGSKQTLKIVIVCFP